MQREIRVLMVEDVATDAELELRELQRAGFACITERVDNEPELRRALRDFKPDIILSDFTLSGTFDGQRALTISQELAPQTPFIFVSGTIGEERAVDSLKGGATDYILKTNLLRLADSIRRALNEAEQREARKKAEQEIEEQRQFLRRIIDLNKNMIFAKDREGRFILANDALARIFGISPDVMIGKTNADFMPDPELVSKYQQEEKDVMETCREKFYPEVEIRDIEGNTRWLQTVISPIISADGQVEMLLAVGTDITERKRMEDDLRQSVARFETLSSATNDAVWDWDLNNDKLWWNESFKTLFGYREDDINPEIGFWTTHIHPDDRSRVEKGIHEIIYGQGNSWSDEYRFERRDGNYAYVLDRGFVIRNRQGKGVRMIGAMMDMTERHEQEMKIARLNRIRDVLNGINYTIIRVRDRQKLCEEACRIAVEHGNFAMAWIGLANPASRKIVPLAIYGADKGFLEVASFAATIDAPDGQNLVSRSLHENRPVISNDVITTSGIQYRQELLERGFRSFAVLPLSVGGEAVGTFTLYSYELFAFDEEEMKLLKDMAGDISFALEYIDKEQQLNYLAYNDVLTGLANRILFSDRLTQTLHGLEQGELAALLLVDIERFTYINEVFGRYAGDQLLVEIAGRLKKIFPEHDQIARVSADCFAVLVHGVSNAAEVARFLEDKLLPALSVPLMIEKQSLKIAIKSGVAIAPLDGQNAENLFINAEAALKSAKNSGDRYLFYAPDMNALVAEKLGLENKLRQALDRDEFVLFYQPKIDLANGKICGLEALIRWRRQTGLVPPNKFVPLLEETGLILDVGQWVIRQAALEYLHWRELGLNPPSVAVNISPVQLKRRDFVEQTTCILEEYSGARLEFEITETLIMQNLEENISKLNQLRERGIVICIDDFGTGYSSLRYLAKLPVTTLKIDRAFISSLDASPEDTTIVSAIISLARALNMKVIAEGVEKVEHAKLLRLFKCDEMQGYLFSSPVPAHEIAAMLKQERTLKLDKR